MRNIDSRTRLLNSLGLFQGQQQRDEGRILSLVSSGAKDVEIRSSAGGNTTSSEKQKKKLNRHRRCHSDIPARSALHNTVAFKTKLNDENVTQKEERPTRRSSFSENMNIKKDDGGGGSEGAVRFNTVVSGVQIPSRNQYSKRIKQQLWRDRHELHEMVERNTTEFHAENYDWTQVVLDDEMYIDSTSGERVHPCHVLGNSYTEDDDDHVDGDGDGDDSFGFAPLTRSDSIMSER